MFRRLLAALGIRRSRHLGARGERAAARYLRKQGLRILERNVRLGRGEIDIVAEEGSTVIFVEVKSRTAREGSEETGLEKMDSRKRAALRRACNLYRTSLPSEIESCRLDLVTVEFEAGSRGRRVREIRWFPAFLDLDGFGP